MGDAHCGARMHLIVHLLSLVGSWGIHPSKETAFLVNGTIAL